MNVVFNAHPTNYNKMVVAIERSSKAAIIFVLFVMHQNKDGGRDPTATPFDSDKHFVLVRRMCIKNNILYNQTEQLHTS